jgi:hypothetical protein
MTNETKVVAVNRSGVAVRIGGLVRSACWGELFAAARQGDAELAATYRGILEQVNAVCPLRVTVTRIAARASETGRVYYTADVHYCEDWATGTSEYVGAVGEMHDTETAARAALVAAGLGGATYLGAPEVTVAETP